MSSLQRSWAAIASCLFALTPAPGAQADAATDRRVAILKALVRNEPLPGLAGSTRDELAGVIVGSETQALSSPDYVFHCGDPLPEALMRREVRRAVQDASLRYAVPKALIQSVISQESRYDVQALSPAGAMGLMQLMPGTAHELGVVCPYDPRQNILGGSRYLREQRDRFGSWQAALAAYNAGPRAVIEDRVPPVTRLYIRRVMTGWNRRF